MILAIDPGPVRTAFVRFDGTKIWAHAIVSNAEMLATICESGDHVVVEMIASYGMAVGAEVFETCVWIGRYLQRAAERELEASRLLRRDVKLHLCGSSRAKDGNVRQALIDLFGGKAAAIGNKKLPGPLYGIHADEWAALAVAVTWAATSKERSRTAQGKIA